MRRINLTKRSRHDCLHIEAPGCVINVRHKLRDCDGHPVTAVEIIPDRVDWQGDGSRWTFPDAPGARAMNVRVRQERGG
jgi:hypothetical protein